MKEHACNSAAELAWQLADTIAQRLHLAIDLRGHAVLAVSGGKSPIALFEALRVLPLEWQRVTVLLVDERCVPHDHADSNTTLVRQHLLKDQAAAATFVPFFDTLPETEPPRARMRSPASSRESDESLPVSTNVFPSSSRLPAWSGGISGQRTPSSTSASMTWMFRRSCRNACT